MNPTILAVRAVTALYARQLLLPALWIGLGIYVVVMAVIIWISVAVSPWWLLVAIPPTLVIIIALGIWQFLWVLSGRLAPVMDIRQKVAAKKVINHVGYAAEQFGTPRFVILFRVLKDVVVRPKGGESFLGDLVKKPGAAKRDFDDLRKLF